MDPGIDRPEPPVRLGGWSFYFLAKFLLLWKGLIGFHPLENLAFAAVLLAPLQSPKWRLARTLAAVPVACALLYHDSWLPPLDRVLSQAGLLTQFSAGYLLELLGRFVNWQVIAMLALAWAVVRIAQRHLRVGLFVLAGLVGLAVLQPREAPVAVAAQAPQTGQAKAAAPQDPDAILNAFYRAEAQRKVALPALDANGTPFDVIFLHICSLSWDDMQASGLDGHPLWQRMDVLFRHFNSAASYSGPAAIRVNRALCGQGSHQNLYAGVSGDCYLMPGLRKAGFDTQLAMNHDGHFDDFLQLVRAQGVDAPALPLAGLPVPQRAFDNSPIYGDGAVLGKWLAGRAQNAAPHVALYYNSISLHDGNHIAEGPGADLSSAASFKPRLAKLLDELDAFLGKLQDSGRRAVVVIVPEHGAAVRGDRFQIAGLRDIGTPKITTVPVGVTVIGPDIKRSGAPVNVDAPSSYLALSQLVANLMARPPFGENGLDPARLADGLPRTRHVTENEAATILERDGRFLIRQGKDGWRPFPAEGAP